MNTKTNVKTNVKTNALEYAKLCCDTIIKKFPDADLPPVGKFHYHAGVFLSGMERVYMMCGDKKYNNYIKKWLDFYIDKDGNSVGVNDEEFDDIEPSNLVIRYLENGEERYRKHLERYVPLLLSWKCNELGGLWHKMWFPNQMWLDSLYMVGPLAVRYGIMTGNREYIKLIHRQLMLMWENMRDGKTGLLYHAWDQSKKAEWVTKSDGCSEEFWGRAIGWYLVATCDISELLSDDEPLKKDFTDNAAALAKSLINFRDEKSGAWYQVVDKGYRDDNWIETSCTCLYIYGISNLVRRGLLGKEYEEYADKAYKEIIENQTEIKDGQLTVKNICIGTGVGDYEFYINRPRTQNDLHGTGAFTLMCTEYAAMKNR